MLQNLLLALSLTGCIGVSSLNNLNDKTPNTHEVRFLPNRDTSTIAISSLADLPTENFNTGITFTFNGYDDTIYGRVGFPNNLSANPISYIYQSGLNNYVSGVANIGPGYWNSIYNNDIYAYTITNNGIGEVRVMPFYHLYTNRDNEFLNIYLILGKSNVRYLGFLVYYPTNTYRVLSHYQLDYSIIYDTNVYPCVANGTLSFENLSPSNWYTYDNIIRPSFSNTDLPFTAQNSLDFNISLNLHYTQDYVDYLQTSNYSAGFHDAYEFFEDDSLVSMFFAIADTPILMLRSLFDFNILGVSLFGCLLGFLTIVLITFIIRKLI